MLNGVLAVLLVASASAIASADDVQFRGTDFVISYPDRDTKIQPSSAAVPFQMEYRKNSLLRLETERLTQPIDLRDDAFAQIFLEVQLERLRERTDVPLQEQRVRSFSWGPGVELVYFLPSRDGRRDRRDLVTEVTTTFGDTLYRFTYWIPERDLGRVAAPFARVVESFRPDELTRRTETTEAAASTAAASTSRYSLAGSETALASLRARLSAGEEVNAELAEALGWKAYLEGGASDTERSELARYAAAAVAAAPGNAEALKARAWEAYHGDRMTEMEQALSQALALAPDDPEAHLLQALWYGFNPERSEAMAEKAVELDPALVPAHFVKARAEERAGELAEARASLEEAIRLDPGFLEARLELAEVLTKSGDVSAAIDAYRAAVAAAPNDVEPRFRYALALRREGRVSEAVTEYERLLQLDDSLSEVHYNVAVLALQELQKPDVAARHFRRFLELDPANERAESVRRWLQQNGYR